MASEALPALHRPPVAGTPLGLYLHIPFCRKRCHFCYFRVYTDKNAQDVVDYLDVLAQEWETYAKLPAVAGRPTSFVYFGGGTPSFLSTRQLRSLVDRLSAVSPWRDAEGKRSNGITTASPPSTTRSTTRSRTGSSTAR